jgi:ATP-binding cassette subfamily F protein 3
MARLKVNGLAKSFGIHELFKDVSFEIARGDRVGFVGANGAGKTTLLRCLMGQEEYDAGTISWDEGDTIGYVEQTADFAGADALRGIPAGLFGHPRARRAEARARKADGREDHDDALVEEYSRVMNRFEALGGYDYESRIRRVAFGLGFTEEDLKKNVEHFSGGQKTRICLAKALLREPDFLFLDEPTNHLDIRMIEWLEDFLKNEYHGGVLLISHDRYFLDRVATRMIELDHQAVTVYEGNYTYYMRVKTERRAALQTAYEKQQEHIRATEAYIRRFKAGIKAKQARGRQSQLDRLERIVLPPEDAHFDFFKFHQPPECAQRVAELEDVSFSYGQHQIFSHVDLLIRKGDGVALVGPNGAGKTTLLRVLIGELESPTGRVKIGSRVKIGYFSQQHEGLNPENTVLDEICYAFGTSEEQARKYLGAFLFHGDDVLRRIGDLSGGEQSRVAFLKLMLTGANFLVLDEPTNHLDIPAKEAVEEALMAYPGTFLAVSHDRYFLDKVANCTLVLKDGKVQEYAGNYSAYRLHAEAEEKAAEEAQEEERRAAQQKEKAEKAGRQRQEEAEQPAAPRPAAKQEPLRGSVQSMSETKRQELLDRAEAEIAMAEAELKGLEVEMNDPAVQSDPEKSQQMADAYAEKQREIEARYARWERLSEAAEETRG